MENEEEYEFTEQKGSHVFWMLKKSQPNDELYLSPFLAYTCFCMWVVSAFDVVWCGIVCAVHRTL